ncbi:hypothetical protein [Haloferula sp. BvORR071]|uniref:hypothetical protein n=1 Tax=Haloferula sp. BvORR071 TaxID=1396141 RepID=UPI00224102B9|nr:hypothetical protein [Haloferula sp. BvORR071]
MESTHGDLTLWQMSWVLYIVVPFTPLVLEFFHFYRRPRPPSAALAFAQLFKAAICMTLLVGAVVVWAQLGGVSRLILMTGAILTLAVLFLRERVFFAFFDRESSDSTGRSVP